MATSDSISYGEGNRYSNGDWSLWKALKAKPPICPLQSGGVVGRCTQPHVARWTTATIAATTIAEIAPRRRDASFTVPPSGRARRALAVVFGAVLLAQADLQRRHFYQLIVFDELQRLLQRELHRRRQRQRIVLAGGAE